MQVKLGVRVLILLFAAVSAATENCPVTAM
jgi:hypothetical protein